MRTLNHRQTRIRMRMRARGRHRPFACLFLAIWALCGSRAMAEPSPWMVVEGRALYSGTDEAGARPRAIAEAHREAVCQALAKDTTVEDLCVNLRLSGALMGIIPCGQVTESEVLKESVVSATGIRGGEAMSEYRVKLKARVMRCPATPSTGFRLEARLNKAVFTDGDLVILTLSATRDCYYFVFNILEDEKVLQLVPNRVKANNHMVAGKRVSFPDAADTRLGIRPIAHVTPTSAQTTEAIYVLALRKPADFSDSGIQEGLFGSYDGRTAFIKALVRVVATIPINERAEQLIRYQIRAKTKQQS